MSIVPIEHAASNTFGMQARAYVAKGHRPERLTAFFAYDAHGGRRAAKRAAERALPYLQRQAARLRRAFLPRPRR